MCLIPNFAASVKWTHDPQRIQWLYEQGLGVEFSPNPQDVASLKQQLQPCLNYHLPVRLHAFFPGDELGDVSVEGANRARHKHVALLEHAADILETPVVTCHFGLRPEPKVAMAQLEDSLGQLVQRAKALGCVVAIENLRTGLASDPALVARLAEVTDAQITLDVGHALSCDKVGRGEITVREIINLFALRLAEVHYYERETDHHHAPQDMQILGPVVSDLCQHTKVTWWTIELDSTTEIAHTVKITREYLLGKNS